MEVVGKDIQNFQETVRDHSDYDFSDYSHNSLRRRLTRILLEMECEMDELTLRMEKESDFLEQILKKITVHTTELFRDPEIWIKLKTEILPSFDDKPIIRIWHPGCSTGQEIYSMMMLLDHMSMLEKCEIYGSDIQEGVLETARQGVYKFHFNQSYLENFDRVILNGPGNFSWNQRKHWKKYFHINESQDLIQMNDHLRSKPVYKKQDLVRDANIFSVKFDLVICRNVIIYFNPNLQNRVFELFHKNLIDHGVMLLGMHESILGPYSKKFIRKEPFYYKA